MIKLCIIHTFLYLLYAFATESKPKSKTEKQVLFSTNPILIHNHDTTVIESYLTNTQINRYVYFTVTESKSMNVYKHVTKLKTWQTGF